MRTYSMMFGVAAVLVLLAGCAAPSANTIHDQAGREVTIVDTGVDQAGGPRLVTIGQFDAARQYHVLAAANGPGAAQTLLPSLITAGGFVAGMAVLRPPQVNNTTTATSTQGGSSISPGAIVVNGGAGGSSTSAGGSASASTAPITATGGAATTTSNATSSATSISASSASASGSRGDR